MVYSTDRSKAVAPILVLLFVAVWFIQRGDYWLRFVIVALPGLFSYLFFFFFFFFFFVLSLALCYFVLVFFSPFSLRLPRLGEERANLSAFRTFVRIALVWFCLFPLPLPVWDGLRIVIVAPLARLSLWYVLLFFFFFFFFFFWCEIRFD